MRKNRTRKGSVSGASSYSAMGDFWDTHDLSDFWDKTHPVKADVHLEAEESLYSVEKDLSQTIRKIAHKKGVSPHTLINLWLQEKIHKLKLTSGH